MPVAKIYYVRVKYAYKESFYNYWHMLSVSRDDAIQWKSEMYKQSECITIIALDPDAVSDMDHLFATDGLMARLNYFLDPQPHRMV